MRSRGDLTGVPSVLTAITRAAPWVDRAACADPAASETTWIMEPSTERYLPHLVAAKLRICAACPVRRECLEYALTTDFQAFGVWGGTTTVERRAARRRYGDPWTLGRVAYVQELADAFEATFDQRLAEWERRGVEYQVEWERTAPERERRARQRRLEKRARVTAAILRPAGSCRACDRPFTWRDRSDARFCSGRCRQAAYRHRAALLAA